MKSGACSPRRSFLPTTVRRSPNSKASPVRSSIAHSLMLLFPSAALLERDSTIMLKAWFQNSTNLLLLYHVKLGFALFGRLQPRSSLLELPLNLLDLPLHLLHARFVIDRCHCRGICLSWLGSVL